MEEGNVYIEDERICEESRCKYFKRLIVGLIRFIGTYEEDQEVNIPEHFFNDVPDHVGFSFEFYEDEHGDDLRSFFLTDTWETDEDDCGGIEQSIDDVVFNAKKDNVIHLRLISNDREE